MKFFLSGFSVFPSGPERVTAFAKELGFDGVELLLAGRALRNPEDCRNLAKRAGIALHFHEAWTAENATTQTWLWKLLQVVGFLPKDGTSFFEMVPPIIVDPVVVYADRFGVTSADTHWFQTCSVMGKDGYFQTPYLEFRKRFLEKPQGGIVFDTYHLPEWASGRPGHDWLVLPKEEVLRCLINAFDDFWPWVREIHLADCSRERGRNCLIGEGELPLREFCRHVVGSGWKEGTVTPEVDPRLLFCRPARLRETLRTAREMFRV